MNGKRARKEGKYKKRVKDDEGFDWREKKKRKGPRLYLDVPLAE